MSTNETPGPKTAEDTAGPTVENAVDTPDPTPGPAAGQPIELGPAPTLDPTAGPTLTPEQHLEIPVNDTQLVTPAGPTAGLTSLPSRPTLPPQFTLDDGSGALDERGPVVDGGDVDGGDADGGTGSGVLGTRIAGSVAAAPRVRRSVRVRTVVFGLVVLAISVVSLVALLTEAQVDGGVVGLGLLIGAGAALVAGGIASAVREARGGPGAAH